MGEPSAAEAEVLRRRISTYILIRLVLATLFLVFLAFLTFGAESVLDSAVFLDLVAVTLALLALSAAGLARVPRLDRFAWLQLMVDMAIVTAVVSQTGGSKSVFTVLYFMTIVASAYLVYARGALVCAVLDSVAFVAVSLMVHAANPPLPGAPGTPLYADVLIGVFGFFLVAILAGQLAEQLRLAGQALVARERQALRLEQELAGVVGSLRSGLAVLEPGGVLRSANDRALQLFPRLSADGATQAIPRFEERLGLWEVEAEASDGELRNVIVSATPLPDGAHVLSMEDVTRLRGMERTIRHEERQAAVGRLAAAMAHEIRNPLTSLSGAVQLMATDQDDRLVAIVRREVNRLEGLVEDFLDSARPRPLRRRPVDLAAVVDETVTTFRRDQRYADLVEVQIRQHELPEVLCDPDKVRQLLWNLLLNAAQAMPEGGRVRVTCRATGGKARILVSDEGNGIDPLEVSKIFDPFYTTRSGGTGLGLAMVDRIAREHGGEVWVQSEPGSGTTFALWLPLGDEQAAPEVDAGGR